MDTTLLIIAKSEAGDFKTTCSTSCGGVPEAHGECCNISGKNSIVGPIRDSSELIQRLQTKFPGITHEEVFISFEEARQKYPEKEVCQDPYYFPAMRPAEDGRCIFYKNKGCSIQQEKSIHCKSYVCEYLRKLNNIKSIYPPGIPIKEEEFRGVKENLISIT